MKGSDQKSQKINEIETKKVIEKDQWSQEIVLWEKINKIDRLLIQNSSKKEQKTQILKTKN